MRGSIGAEMLRVLGSLERLKRWKKLGTDSTWQRSEKGPAGHHGCLIPFLEVWQRCPRLLLSIWSLGETQ